MVSETELPGGQGWRLGEGETDTRGKRSGVAQSKPAGCEGAAGRGRVLPSIWGCPVGQPRPPRPAARGLACPGQHRSGRETGEQAGAHSTPALLTDTMPPGVGTTVIPFDRWENSLKKAKKHAEASQQVGGQEQA